MATFTTNEQFRLDWVSFRDLINGDLQDTRNNDVTPWGGPDYPDQFGYDITAGETTAGDPDRFIMFGGSDIRFSGGEVVGGRVTGIIEFDDHSGSCDPIWTLEGIDIPAMAIVRAIGTATIADDLALFGRALAGDDTILLSSGSDFLRGYAGNDRMVGRGGDDLLLGDGGRDEIEGGAGNDTLQGGAGCDEIQGGDGADRLVGGAGRDVLSGGDDRQRDVFVFNAAADSPAGPQRDVVHDFVHGIDMLDLSRIDANADRAGDQALAFSTSGARAHSVWLIEQGKDFILRADVTGDRMADLELRVTQIDTLAGADFVL